MRNPKALGVLVVVAISSCASPPPDENAESTNSGIAYDTPYAFGALAGSNGACLDATGAGTGDGTQIEEWGCNTSGAQGFMIEDAGNGASKLVNPNANKCIDIANMGTANGTQIRLWDCNGTDAQSFVFYDAGNGMVSIANPHSGKCLDVQGANPASGTLVQLYDCNGTVAQQWTIRDFDAATPPPPSQPSTPSGFTALYGGDGNDFYRFTGQSSVNNLKGSGWNSLLMFTLNVEANGDLTGGSDTIVSNGNYMGDSNWGANVAALKTQPTSVTRYEVSVGGWGSASYDHIKSLVNQQGTGDGSILQRNFQALKRAVPGIDAINDDDEQTYDLGSSVAFGQMLNRMGMKLSQVPYMNQGFWVQLKNSLGDGSDIVYLQCYQGGAGNDPGQWDAAYGNGFHVVPGQESNNHSASWWSDWGGHDGVTGGFYWPDVTWAPGANWGPAEITGGLASPSR